MLSLSFFGIINIGAAYLMILPFSAPIPTSSFIRVALCICGMACQDMSYLASSIPMNRTDRFLGDVRFDLQIDNVPRGSEDTVYGNGLFF